jgi:hypothetical protein
MSEGVAIPHARATATNEQTMDVRMTTADEDAAFVLMALPPRYYTLLINVGAAAAGSRIVELSLRAMF